MHIIQTLNFMPLTFGKTGYYGPEMVDYQVSWMTCIHKASSYALDYMGLWNEKPQVRTFTLLLVA